MRSVGRKIAEKLAKQKEAWYCAAEERANGGMRHFKFELIFPIMIMMEDNISRVLEREIKNKTRDIKN